MTITINLKPEDESRLRRRAVEQGTTPEELVEELVRREIAPNGQSDAQSSADAKAPTMTPDELREYWKDYIGVVDSSKTDRSKLPQSTDPYEVAFGEIMVEKYRKQGFDL